MCGAQQSKTLNAHTMHNFNIKSISRGSEIQKPHFFILNKGMNSGKPLQMPCPNCFVFICETEQEREFYYWLIFGLWRSKSFLPYLRGSVIPFIILRDFYTSIQAGTIEAKTNLEQFQKNIAVLKLLELKEKQFHENLRLIEDVRKSIFYRYQNKRG